MSLADYQEQVDKALDRHAKRYWDPLSQLAYLTEELGEISRIMNNRHGDKPKKPGEHHDPLEDELADLIFGIICIANRAGLSLDDAMDKTIAKVNGRDRDRFKKKSE